MHFLSLEWAVGDSPEPRDNCEEEPSELLVDLFITLHALPTSLPFGLCTPIDEPSTMRVLARSTEKGSAPNLLHG